MLLSAATTFVFADVSRTGKILDAFKEQEKEYLFDVIPFSQTDEQKLFEREKVVSNLESYMSRINNAKTQYASGLSNATRKRKTLENAISELDTSIESTLLQIQRTEGNILAKEWEIISLEGQISDMSKKIQEQREIILKYVNIIYNQGTTVYDNKENVDVLKVLIMDSEDLSSIFLNIHYNSLVAQLWKEYMDNYRVILGKFESVKAELEIRKKELDDEKIRLEYDKRMLLYQRADRENLLNITKWEESLYAQFLTEQENAEKVVKEQWQNMYNNYLGDFKDIAKDYGCLTSDVMNMENETGACLKVKQFYKLEQKLLQYTLDFGTGNVFSWPVQANRISTYFHDESYYKALGSEHEAIDIPVNQWSDVKSVAPGYVYYVLPPTPEGYSYMAIRHPDWLVSVYGHLSEILVEPFQFVEQWQLIAKSGWQPGTPGAWPMTTWPHLHFEVWKNRESVDPLRYLNISDLNFDDLASRYKFKYIEDLKDRYGSGANLSKYQVKLVIRWANEQERQKYLLWQYAAPAFNDWNIWTEEALAAKIDPSFLMCVWLAESSLGNRLKTPYNIWNVGNTDSGDTYTFGSAREWVNWMTKTFNNKFLAKYNAISDLSGWGNKTGTIYASSKTNWHNNVIHCMSALKWRFIEDDYNFRIQSK